MELVLKILVAVILPALIAFVSAYKRGFGKRLLLECGAVVLIGNLAAIGILFLLPHDKTIYEFLGISSAVAVLVSYLGLPLLRDRKLDPAQVLTALCLCSVVAATYSILTYGRTILHSDTATAVLLNQSQLSSGSLFPKSWNYVNGDLWVITISTFTFPFVALMDNLPLARMLGSAVYVLVCLAALVYHSNAGFKNKSWTLSVTIILLFLCASNRGFILYEAAYTSCFAWIALCSLFTFQIHSEPGKKGNYVILALMMMALCAAGIRNLAEQMLPLLGGYVFFIYMQIREQERVDWKSVIKDAFRVGLTIVIPSAIGYALHIWITSKGNMVHTANDAMRFVASLDQCWQNLITTLQNFFDCFGFVGEAELFTDVGIRNMVSVIMCAIIVFFVPVLQAKKLKQETPFVQFFFWYGLFHNLIMIILAVFFGKTESRYLLTSVFICIILSARYIYAYWISQLNFRKVVWTGLFVIASLIYVFPLLSASAGWADTLAAKQQFNQQLVDRGVTKAYGSYWNAYNNEVYSNSRIRFGAIDNIADTLSPFCWLVDDSAFDDRAGRSCLLMNDGELAAIQYANAPLLASAAESFTGNGLHAYIFDYDIISAFRWRLRDGIIPNSEMHHNEHVVRSEEGLSLDSQGIIYGPYSLIAAGKYLVTYVGSNLENCEFSAYSTQRPDAVRYELISADSTHHTIKLTVSEAVSDLELAVYGHSDSQRGVLQHIELETLH